MVQAFSQKFPKVRLSLLQGNPKQVADMVLNDQADLAIATEAIADIDGLVSLPCFQWEHMVVVPPSHPLAQSKSLTLEELATFPLITYDAAFASLTQIVGQGARRAISYLTLFGGLASTVFWPVSHYLALGIGWADTLLVYAALHIVVCLPIHWAVLGAAKGERESNHEAAAAPASPGRSRATAG